MTEVVIRSHSPSPSNHHFPSPSSSRPGFQRRPRFGECSESERDGAGGDQVSLLEVLFAAFRKSLVGCSVVPFGSEEGFGMKIGFPTDVRHVAHVTFHSFDGFLGLPVEFEPDVPRTSPSARTTVFGVSTDSMQLSYDSRGNSVPTILLLMQRHLYALGGLQAEGIFRINAHNGKEEYVRDQLNRGVIPEAIDVHCLTGLIKAWFRELPTGILDTLLPEQVMQSESEEHCAQLVGLLSPMEAALFDWAINLMADVAQHEHLNKMNARNIAVVFAPNMTKMSEPLTALMYTIQVMNFLKTLITRTLRSREDPVIVSLPPSSSLDPSDNIEPQSNSFRSSPLEAGKETEKELIFIQKLTPDDDVAPKKESLELPLVEKAEVVSQVNSLKQEVRRVDVLPSCPNSWSSRKSSRSRKLNNKRGSSRVASLEKGKGGSTITGGMNSRAELVEAWRR